MREPDPFVYYVTRADKPGLVKIGTTTNLRERMRALAWRAGPVTLLATEPGGRALESRRHKQFAGLRQAGEWFTLAEELHRHIHRLSDLQPSVT